jgi:hypothetical protein
VAKTLRRPCLTSATSFLIAKVERKSSILNFMSKCNRGSQNVTHVYFHCSSDRGILIDQYGAAVDNLVEARDHAARVVRSLIMARSANDCRDWVLHVNDDAGVEIFVVPFALVLGKAP